MGYDSRMLAMDWEFVRFEQPGYLALLALLPLIVVFSFRSLAGLGPVRRWLAIGLRCLVLLIMVFALAGAERTKKNDDLSVIFVLDRSNSIPRELQKQEFEFVQHANGARKPNDQLGVIAFDGQSAIEQLPMGSLALDRLNEPVQPDQTDMAAALRLAMALFPPDTARRIVVLSDGNENIGNALEEADHLRAAGVPVDVVPVRYSHDNEVVFERLAAPATASKGQKINLQMFLRATRPTGGQIIVYQDDKPIRKKKVSLPAGSFRDTVEFEVADERPYRFSARFEPDDPKDDAIPSNNEGRAFTVVSGPGKALILTSAEDAKMARSSAQILAEAIQSEKLETEIEIAGENPLTQERLLGYSLVILNNVHANNVPEEGQEALAHFVRDLGGGLMMIGGDNSFGQGGWMGSPVEEVMPVSFDVKNKKQIPKGALVLVMHACEIPQGNYWGERVAVASVKTLSSRDLCGILSFQWNSAAGYWVAPLQEVGNKTALVQQILKMQMGDMPDLHAVMQPGVEALIKREDAAVKHMIVISDFDPSPPSDELIKRMQDHKITCSTVAIGYGGHWINEGLAQDIAARTGGKFYATKNFSELPQIFMKDSRIVQRSLLFNNTFRPQVRSESTAVPGLRNANLPSLGGHVLTTGKPAAMVPLVRVSTEPGENEPMIDPILAHWQVGLGKAVAFTGGMWNTSWGAAWAGWEGFPAFWGQLARWAARQPDSASLSVRTFVQGGKGRITVEALDKDASSINFMIMKGKLLSPSQQSQELELTQTGPGIYEAEFDAREKGSYIASLRYINSETGEVAKTLRTGVSVAYSPEYRELVPNMALMDELRERAGGRTLKWDESAGVFSRSSLPRAESRTLIWEDLIRWMLFLFLLDVAVRRIAINPLALLRKGRDFIAEMGGRRQPAAATVEVLTGLKGTRERVREAQTARGGESGAAIDPAAKFEADRRAKQSTEELSKALGGAGEDAPVVAKPTGKKPPQSEADYTARLLQAKRRAREELEDKDKPEDKA